MQEDKNYMDLMNEFFFETSKLKNNATNLAKATELFWLSKHKYDEFKKEMFENREKGMERIIFAYQQLLKRVTQSPSNIHMRSAVVIAMPLLADALSSAEVK